MTTQLGGGGVMPQWSDHYVEEVFVCGFPKKIASQVLNLLIDIIDFDLLGAGLVPDQSGYRVGRVPVPAAVDSDPDLTLERSKIRIRPSKDNLDPVPTYIYS